MSDATSSTRGRLLYSLKPQGVGVMGGGVRASASWPFPRGLKIYEHGLGISALGNEVWVGRGTISSIRHLPGEVRFEWEGMSNDYALANSWLHIDRVIQSLEAAGYSVAR